MHNADVVDRIETCSIGEFIFVDEIEEFHETVEDVISVIAPFLVSDIPSTERGESISVDELYKSLSNKLNYTTSSYRYNVFSSAFDEIVESLFQRIISTFTIS